MVCPTYNIQMIDVVIFLKAPLVSPFFLIIKPRRACVARVTVLVLCVCMCVCVSTHTCHLTHWDHKREIPEV